MNILIVVILILAAVIIIIMLIAALASPTYEIVKDISVNKSQTDVFNFIKMVRNQELYSIWVMRDPNSRKTVSGTDGTVGYSYAWDSDNKQVGQGIQTITAVTAGETMISQVQFIKPFAGMLDASYTTKAVSDNQTRVTWLIKGDRNFMMRIFHVVFQLEKSLGKDMQASLVNLKNLLEK